MKDGPKFKEKILFGALAGSLYILVGSIQFVLGISAMLDISSVHLLEDSAFGLFFAPSDLIGSLVLMLIGSIFIYGLMELRNGLNEGIAYVYVGIILSLLFAIVYILVMSGNWMESYLLSDPGMAGWSFSDDFRPAIYLGTLSLCGYILWNKDFRSINK